MLVRPLFACLLFCLHCQLLAALRCGRCDLSNCRLITPGSCAGGVTTDLCDCCPVCAKLVNQTCGGSYGLLGKCGEGLECALTSKIGGRITGSEAGICREKVLDKCANVTCKWPYGQYCPEDSVVMVTEANSSECCNKNAKCVCNIRTCKVTQCDLGQEAIHLKRGNGIPGSCCDHVVCQKSEICKERVCPVIREKRCPKDSKPRPKAPSPDGCCYRTQGCECKVCPDVRCPKGLQVHIHSKGKHIPGHCCTNFICVNESELTCRHNGKEYSDGNLWQPDHCTQCQCRRGITFCKVETCANISLCPYMEVPEGACCHVCKGCLLDGGHIKKNGDSWRDNCKICRCVEGETQCNQQLCETRCLNPIYIPGKCCPVCDHSTPEPPCPSLQSCRKECAHGYMRRGDGCQLCMCNKCSSLDTCQKHCRYGFQVDLQGCQICRCRDLSYSHLRSSTPKNKLDLTQKVTTPGEVLDPAHKCLTQGGQLREEGEVWYDGCRQCYCHQGKEMCSLISCPRPLCSAPVFKMGDCCPRCQDADSNQSPGESSNKGSNCISLTGFHVMEGETWTLDNCTTCLCYQGQALCQRQTCPPLLCSHPIISVGKCCPHCSDENSMKLGSTTPIRSCHSDRGVMYKDGEVWRTTPCQTCVCSRGQISCFSQTCLPVSCNHTVMLKGQCCPTCVKAPTSGHDGCTTGETTYREGESFMSNNCSTCYCTQGKIQCSVVNCEIPHCKYLVRYPDSCCPVCLVPEAKAAEDLSSTATAVICILSITTMVVIVLTVVFIYRLRRSKNTAKNKLHQSDAAPLTNTRVQLLGYHKGDNSETPANDNFDKCVNEKLLVTLDKPSVLIKDTNMTPRVSFYDGCDDED